MQPTCHQCHPNKAQLLLERASHCDLCAKIIIVHALEVTMFKKKFLKTKCKVTFELPEAVAERADNVYLVGDFNNWDEQATPMEKKKGNRFSVTVDLEP